MTVRLAYIARVEVNFEELIIVTSNSFELIPRRAVIR
jgi:hypothetical protein